MKKNRSLILLVSIGLFLSACGKKEISYEIALAAPITGDLAAMGEGMRNATMLAVEEANASGKFKYKVKAGYFDDRADPKEAVNVANQIVSNPNILAVVGHLNSGCSIPASQVYANKALLMITPATTNPKLTVQQLDPSWKFPKMIFRVNTTDDVQGQYGANFLCEKLKVQAAAIIHDKTPYGQGLAEEFQKKFLANGGKVVSFDGIQVGDKDFKALLTRIKSLHPQAIYFGGVYNEAGLIAKQAKELDLKTIFMSGDANQSPEFIKIAGNASEGCYISNVGLPQEKLPTAKSFSESYMKRFPNVDFQPYDHYTYEAAKIVLSAIEHVVNPNDPATVERAKILNYVRTIKYVGVLGTTEFDEKGDTKNKAVTIYIVKDGKFSPIN